MTKVDFIDDTESAPSTSRGYKYTLFVPPRDAHEALWGGEVSGVEGAISTFGADEVSPLLVPSDV